MSQHQTKYLGESHTTAIKAEDLDTVPWEGHEEAEISLDCTEFTSHCPVTGQPDFAQLRITYVPQGRLLETKSLKLYLWSFRQTAEFNERLVQQIADDIDGALKPRELLVHGQFHPRGGIQVSATCAPRR